MGANGSRVAPSPNEYYGTASAPIANAETTRKMGILNLIKK
jgi:hypothetical protein